MATAANNAINKIHVNSSTRISLNDRFTVIQSTSPTNGTNNNSKPSIQRKSPLIGNNRRKRSISRGRNPRNGNGPKQASMANRKFLEQLEKKHKIQAALKLKRRSLKTTSPPMFRRGGPGQRLNNRIRGYGRARGGGITGRLLRSNSLANIATMKADLMSAPVANRLKRSNSTSRVTARLGMLRRNSASQNSLRIRNRRNSNNYQQQQPVLIRGRSRSRQRNLSRSNSQSNLIRSNSRSNLNRTNSRNSLNGNGQRRGRSRSISRNRQNNRFIGGTGNGRRGGLGGNGTFRSASRSRKNSQSTNLPVHSRLGIKRLPINSNRNNSKRLNQQSVGNGRRDSFRGVSRRGGIAQGRIKRRNSTGGFNNIINNGIKKSTGVRQGRNRGRGNIAQRRPSSQSRGRSAQRTTNGQRGSRRGRSRGRGGRAALRGINRPSGGQKSDLKKEDLDKELDQYMSTTAKNSSDIEM